MIISAVGHSMILRYKKNIYGFFLFLFFHPSLFCLKLLCGLPIVSVPGGCYLGSRYPLPFCHQYHHLHIHPSSFAEVIFWSLLSSSSFICSSSCFHCSLCAALPEQTSSTSTKVCAPHSHICHRGLDTASLSVRWPPPVCIIEGNYQSVGKCRSLLNTTSPIGRFASSSDRWAPGVWKYFWIPSQELMDPANVWEPPQWELFSYMLTYPINIVQSPDRSWTTLLL